VRELAERLCQIPGVVAVTSGGSRASGTALADSDWDFGLYYRGELRAEDVRALGFEGTVAEAGEWGRLANGGASLTVEGRRVDLLYRDLDVVRHWVGEAEAGRYEVDLVEGYLAGMASYVLVGELALAEVLAGDLPRPRFPQALQRSAPRRWRRSAACSLEAADSAAARHDVVACAGLLAKAATEAAQAALAERGEWALTERGIVRQAGLAGRVVAIMAVLGDRQFELTRAVTAMRAALEIPCGRQAPTA
jgi:predicted nucleotidyltransferase